MSLKEKIKSLASILGLKGNITLKEDPTGELVKLSGPSYEGAVQRAKERYKLFTGKNLQLSIIFCNHRALSKEKFLKKINEMPTGTSFSIATGWTGHAVSVSFLKFENKLYISFLNKGERYGSNKLIRKKDNLMYFTLPDSKLSPLEKDCVLECVYEACTSGDKKQFEQAIFHSPLTKYYDTRLESLLPFKNYQKVGNCGYANINQTWLFSLILENYASENSLEEVYFKHEETYKTLRVYDRAIAFGEFLLEASNITSGEENVYKAYFDKIEKKGGVFRADFLKALHFFMPDAIPVLEPILDSLILKYPGKYDEIKSELLAVKAENKVNFSELALNTKLRLIEKRQRNIVENCSTLTKFHRLYKFKKAYRYLNQEKIQTQSQLNKMLRHTQPSEKSKP